MPSPPTRDIVIIDGNLRQNCINAERTLPTVSGCEIRAFRPFAPFRSFLMVCMTAEPECE